MKTIKLYYLTPIGVINDYLDIDCNICKNDKDTHSYISPSVYGCLCACNIPERLPALTNFKEGIKIKVLSADVNVEDIIIPTSEQIADAWFTREVFITKSYRFRKLGVFVLRLQSHIDGEYCRFTFCKLEDTPIKFISNKPQIYGDEFNFSFIALNPNSINTELWYH